MRVLYACHQFEYIHIKWDYRFNSVLIFVNQLNLALDLSAKKWSTIQTSWHFISFLNDKINSLIKWTDSWIEWTSSISNFNYFITPIWSLFCIVCIWKWNTNSIEMKMHFSKFHFSFIKIIQFVLNRGRDLFIFPVQSKNIWNRNPKSICPFFWLFLYIAFIWIESISVNCEYV